MCSRLRALEETRRTPLLATDRSREVEKHARALEITDGFVTLPIHAGELLAHVESQVRRKRYWDHLRQGPARAREGVDPLTNMHDRRHLERHLGALVSRNVMRDRPVSLLLMDVDDFQRVNDTYDHDVGDEVLREIARRICSSLRGLDLSCRFGGEGFVAAFPGVDGAIAHRIGERLRRNVGDHPFPIATDHGPLEVTISIGSATTSGRGDTADALLERADSALYRAKKEGRNCVACA